MFKGMVVMAGAALLLRAGHRRLSAKAGEFPLQPERAPLDVSIEVGPETAKPEFHSADVLELRDLLRTVDRRNEERISAMSLRLDDLQTNLPGLIDIQVTARVNELEQQLKAEIVESGARAARIFAESFEPRLVLAISGIEASLSNQGIQIAEFRDRLGRTDQSLARILATVERLAGAAPEARFPVYANGEAAVNGR